jgi:hypothetical protein
LNCYVFCTIDQTSTPFTYAMALAQALRDLGEFKLRTNGDQIILKTAIGYGQVASAHRALAAEHRIQYLPHFAPLAARLPLPGNVVEIY